VIGDVFEVAVVVLLEHVVEEVDVEEAERGPLESLRGRALIVHALVRLQPGEHVPPAGVRQRHDHLVNVEQRHVVVAVQVAVQAVVVGDYLVLPLVRHLVLEIQVPEDVGVGLRAGQRQRRQVHHALGHVVVQEALYVRMDGHLVQKDLQYESVIH
jgi:hypothetical protein